MRILIMSCSNNTAWYKNKIGKAYKATDSGEAYITKDGVVKKEDAEVIT